MSKFKVRSLSDLDCILVSGQVIDVNNTTGSLNFFLKEGHTVDLVPSISDNQDRNYGYVVLECATCGVYFWISEDSNRDHYPGIGPTFGCSGVR